MSKIDPTAAEYQALKVIIEAQKVRIEAQDDVLSEVIDDLVKITNKVTAIWRPSSEAFIKGGEPMRIEDDCGPVSDKDYDIRYKCLWEPPTDHHYYGEEGEKMTQADKDALCQVYPASRGKRTKAEEFADKMIVKLKSGDKS